MCGTNLLIVYIMHTLDHSAHSVKADWCNVLFAQCCFEGTVPKYSHSILHTSQAVCSYLYISAA